MKTKEDSGRLPDLVIVSQVVGFKRSTTQRDRTEAQSEEALAGGFIMNSNGCLCSSLSSLATGSLY